MIQLATAPNASRTNYRPAAEGKAPAFAAQRGRAGHAWPFISRYAARPASPQNQKPAANDNGS